MHEPSMYIDDFATVGKSLFPHYFISGINNMIFNKFGNYRHVLAFHGSLLNIRTFQ